MAFYILFAIDLALVIMSRAIIFAVKKQEHKYYHPRKMIFVIFLIVFIASFYGNIGYKIALTLVILDLVMVIFVDILEFLRAVFEIIDNN